MARRSFAKPDDLPGEVSQLFPREREIASIVYRHGPATANAIGRMLSKPLTNSSLRSMLNRLVRKGILNRQPAIRGLALIYSPCLSTEDTKEKALRQFADDYFEGSLQQAAAAVIDTVALRDGQVQTPEGRR